MLQHERTCKSPLDTRANRLSSCATRLSALLALAIPVGCQTTRPEPKISPSELFEQAEEHRRHQRVELAERFYRETLEADPQRHHAHYWLSSIHEQQGRLDQALHHLDEAISLQPGDIHHYRARGAILLEQGRFSEASLDFTRALQIRPTTADFHLRARARWSQDDVDGALHDLERAAELAPRKPGLHFARGLVSWERGDLDQAERHFGNELVRFPEQSEPWEWRGELRFVRGDWDGAVADFTELLEREPQRSELYRKRALAFLRRGDLERARTDADTAVKADPASALNYAVRCQVFTAQERWEQAFQDGQQAVALGRNQPEPYLARGRLRVARKRDDRARDDFQRAVSLGANHAESYFRRGKFLAHHGESVQAMEDLTACVERDPTHARAWYQRGLLHRREELQQEALTGVITEDSPALEDFTRALQIQPLHGDARLARSDSWARRNRFAEALADLRQVLQFDPEHATALARHESLMERVAPWVAERHRQGVDAAARGDLRAARIAFEETLALEPDRDEARLALVQVLLEGDDTAKAREHLEWLESQSAETSGSSTSLQFPVARTWARLLYREGDYAEALDRYLQAQKAYAGPGVAPRFLAERAECNFQLGNYRKAMNILEAQRTSFPLNVVEEAFSWNLTGQCWERLDRHDEALRSFRMARRINPAFAEPGFHVARLLEDGGQIQDALEEYQELSRELDLFAAALRRQGALIVRLDQQERELDAELLAATRENSLEDSPKVVASAAEDPGLIDWEDCGPTAHHDDTRSLEAMHGQWAGEISSRIPGRQQLQ